MKRCIYCGAELSEERVIDVCEKCGQSVWGEKMFSAIVENMKEARIKGDLDQGNVFENNQDQKDFY